jgi:hypothetical protein
MIENFELRSQANLTKMIENLANPILTLYPGFA